MTNTNTYTGETNVAGGTLALIGDGSIAQSSGVNLSTANANLDISGASNGAAVNNLSGVSGSQVNLGAQTLTVNSNADTSYAGVVAGTGGLVKNGSGSLVLSGDLKQTGDTVLNTGALILDGLTGGAQLHSNVIGQSGANLVIKNGARLTGWIDPVNVSIGGGSTWDMTGNSIVDNLNNNGLIGFQGMQNGVGKNLTVQGVMTGAGTIGMNVKFDGSNVHDLITVNGGQVTGQQSILVNNSGGNGSNSTIRIVDVINGGTVSPGSFTLANYGGRVSAGLYDYYLTQGDSGSKYNQVLTPKINGTASQGVPLVLNAAQVYGEFLVPSVDTLDSVVKDGDHFWMRSLFNQYTNAESGTVNSNNKMYGIQIGKDLFLEKDPSGSSEKAGVYLAYGEQSASLSGQLGAVANSSLGSNALINQTVGGYYGIKLPNDFYASTVLQATRYGVTTSMIGANTINTTGFGLLGSLEIGKSFDIYRKQLVITPEAQFIAQQVRMESANFNGTNVQYSYSPVLTSRLGLKLSTESEPDDLGRKSSAWITLNAYDTTGISPSATFSSQNGLASSVTSSQLTGLAGGLQLGASGDLTKSWSGSVTASYLQGLKTSPTGSAFGVQAILKYSLD